MFICRLVLDECLTIKTLLVTCIEGLRREYLVIVLKKARLFPQRLLGEIFKAIESLSRFLLYRVVYFYFILLYSTYFTYCTYFWERDSTGTKIIPFLMSSSPLWQRRMKPLSTLDILCSIYPASQSGCSKMTYIFHCNVLVKLQIYLISWAPINSLNNLMLLQSYLHNWKNNPDNFVLSEMYNRLLIPLKKNNYLKFHKQAVVFVILSIKFNIC